VDACGRIKNNNVSVQMKALIDRGNLLLHCQKLRGKYAAMVVTSGGSDPEDVENYFKSILKLYGFWMVGSIGAVEAQFEDAERVFTDMMDTEKRIEIKKRQPLNDCHYFVTLL